MHPCNKILFTVCLFIQTMCFNASHTYSQTCADTNAHCDVVADSLASRKVIKPFEPDRPPDFINTFIYDFFTTLNAVTYENEQSSTQHDELNFYYNTTINNIFKTKYFTIRSYMFNEFGIRYFIDSITNKAQDQHEVRNNVQIPLKKNLKLNLGFTVKTQLWRHFEYRPDSSGNGLQRYLYTDYFSPGYMLYTCGFSLSFMRNAVLDIGLVGGKTTKIKNQNIFDDRRATTLYGLQKGETKKFNYGINVQLNVPPQKIGKHFGWECYTTAFVTKEQIGRLKGYTIDATNVFHYLFLKNLRVTLRTTVKYDELLSDKIFMMNMLSVGFYLSNKL